MSELRETIARIIDPEAWEPWEGYPIGQRAALEKADLVLALPQLAETSAAVGVLLEYDGEFDTGYRFIKTGDTPRPEWLRGVTTTPLFALPQLASVGRDSSSRSQPCADAGPEARARTEAEPSAFSARAHRWPQPGDKMRFLAANGYDHQLAEALDVFEPGAVVTVANCNVGGWEHSIEFKELPGKRWNGVMFTLLPDAPLPNTPLSAGKEG